MQRQRWSSTLFALFSSVILIVVTACTPIQPAQPTSPLPPSVVAQAILTKEEAIKRATMNMPDAELLDARLLYLAEAQKAIGIGGGSYRQLGYYRDDPVWMITVRSKAVANMPMSGEGVTAVTTLTTAVDGQQSTLLMMPEENVAAHLQRLQTLPDRTRQLVIIPRPLPPPLDTQSTGLENYPQGVITTKEKAIRRATFGLTDATVLDVRLLRHDEALTTLDEGVAADIRTRLVIQDDWEFADMLAWRQIEMGLGIDQVADDPAWVVTLASQELDHFSFFRGGPFHGIIIITSAADGQRSRMVAMVDPATDLALQRLQALPDRTGQMTIIPRDPPTPYPTQIPNTTPTPVPVP